MRFIEGGGATLFGAASLAITPTLVTQGFERYYIQPAADSVDGAWTNQAGGSSLYAAIDEDVVSDADYVRSALNPSNSSCRVKLEPGQDPNASYGHIIHWRAAKDTTGGETVNMAITLYQVGGDALGAGSVIASFNRDNVDAWTTYSEQLSPAQATTITDYSNLYLEFEATVV